MLAERSDQREPLRRDRRPPTGSAWPPSTEIQGFMQVLAKRLQAIGWDHRALPSPVTPDALVAMRLSALIIDLTVVGTDSWDYLERICNRLPSLAVIVCTGPSSVAQRVRGLRLGADAWVTKPCHPEELICVVEAVLRRHRRTELADLDAPTAIGELTIRPDLHQVYARDASLELTAREFEILDLLARSERVMGREEIYERVWGYAMAHGDRSVDVFVRKLRQKLRSASPTWSTSTPTLAWATASLHSPPGSLATTCSR